MYKAFLRIVRSRTAVRSAFAYGLTACVLWPIPLLNTLHAESCAVLALVGFFVSGLAAIRHFRDGHDPGP